MAEIAFAVPIVQGKESLDRETMDEMLEGRRDEYEAALKEAGITRQTVWHQTNPDGTTLAVVYVEANDEEGVAKFSSSDAPLPAWFRERMKEVHGIDISQPGPPVERVHDIRL